MFSKKINLGKSSVTRIFWTYAIPSILMMLVQSTAGFVDSAFVGRYVGPEGLSAITLLMPIIWLTIGIGAMIAVGGTTLAGISKGAGDHKRSNNLFNVTSSMLAIIGVITGIVLMVSIGKLASIAGATGVTYTYLVQYGRTIAPFLPFFLLAFALGFFLKLDGKPVLSVVLMVSGTITNIVLDYYLIAVLGMGVQGAAIATGASQILPVITMVFVILKNSGWTFKWPKFHGKDIRDILFNGSSELLSNITLAVSGAVINIVILNRVGTDGVAAYAVAMQVASFAASIGYGFSEASQSAISYNLGTGQGDRVVNFLRMTVKVNMVTGVLFCVMAFTLGTPLSRIFVTDAATIAMAAKILRYYGIAFLFMGSNITFGTYYTAINDPIRSGGITLYRSIIAIAAGLWIFPLVFGSIGIWITIIFAEISTFFVGLHMVRNKPFGRNRLPAHQN